MYIECENGEFKEEDSRLGEYKMRVLDMWAPFKFMLSKGKCERGKYKEFELDQGLQVSHHLIYN